ncbi:MAG: tRNA (adenosine(37)-N6)-threonylcarbamoyltransferase complex ATPase subunit type 1 TsaE [Candidatus Cloacimonetes bacterium HGW-Cloacimonetes-1]|jgi:tRNA threonylcarbamoyl adenosine modification protein YjeE|nr:MAG: tRNA (adenosine(37)-N6)-threonylcarbamoyltransferase complex ATPase subunit type 1 TsaE [Candidatus Cloacimonetes bacterium HGW-Cloacimonetes-1]
MFKKIDLLSEQDTIDLAAFVTPLLKPGDVLCLYGELGSGKTFFTKQVGKFLSINEEIDSPSFVLFKEYNSGRVPLYHLDLYRLRSEEELLDLGIFDMIENGITAIEWPELAENLLPSTTLKLRFHYDGYDRWVVVEPDPSLAEFFE